MSEIKVNKITPTADCGTVTLGDSGDTVAIASGATLTSAGSITNSGTITNTGTISGGTITGTIGGLISWQTTVKTAAFTATAGEGYFVNTTSAAITVTLPTTPSAGDLVAIKDYKLTADTNAITVARNGSKIQGVENDFKIETEGLSVTLIYTDSTQGWLTVNQSQASDIAENKLYVTATGGTVTTSGDYKIHTFTGPGTFTVSCAGNSAGSDKVDYLVIAGGGAGGGLNGGGGGAGGYRFSDGTSSGCYSAGPAPLGASGLSVPATSYPITVGGGGTPICASNGNPGSNSVFSTLTSTGGGGGKYGAGANGGSGGGSGGWSSSPTGGSGNTPPVSPPQGNNGGGANPAAGGGGGGAGAVGSTGPVGNGGNGLASSITASPVTRAGGGGSGADSRGYGSATGSGGSGGGGNGSSGGTGSSATANTGSGGGGGGYTNPSTGPGGNGGSGLVVIRYKYQN
jgi:hypothetical protein